MKKKIFILVLCSILFLTACGKKKTIQNDEPIVKSSNIDLTNMTYGGSSIKNYTIADYENFLSDYQNNSLPSVYITEFLFDGVSSYKIYDLDDFEEKGNDLEISTYETNVLNIKGAGDYELSGNLIGMVAINSNNLSGDMNIILDGVNIDTDSKKIPAIYVYNKDMTYTEHKVTIKTTAGSQNYIEGGKLKKVSLIPSDELSNYQAKYSGTARNLYNSYSNYYGIYNSEQLKNILFATATADNEDLGDGEPYYSYKASGAISSDIDLYFEGLGYLEVISKNKEGIESKGNLDFIGATGDYVIKSSDDCLNTTTKSSTNTEVHNSLSISVNSLTAIVSLDADEGDAIDSNGTLTISNGTIYAFAHPGQDAGLDAEYGTYINGGTVVATGDMYDQINSSSNQRFMVFAFNSSVAENTLITLVDASDNVVFSFVTDRAYTNLVYTSPTLQDGTYYLYKDGSIEGTLVNGVYNNITNYTKGTILGYSGSGMMNGGPGNDRPQRPGDMNMGGFGQSASNKEFVVSGIVNLFSGVSEYAE